MTCSTPVAFIIFRRPDVTARVFEQIRLAQPKKLFVVADGPRNEEETLHCQEARAITEQVDWDCEVFRNYSDINLGCRRCVSSGLDWVFNQAEEAIILEDDCFPDLSFFGFLCELLEKYRYDSRIMHISGNNYQFGNHRGDGSYYFSRSGGIWGWATWARAWKLYDIKMQSLEVFEQEKFLQYIFPDKVQRKIRVDQFKQAITEKIDTWDYQWAYSIYANNGLCIIPNKNLVLNLGFDKDATHTISRPYYYDKINLESIRNISHPSVILPDADADTYDFYIHFPEYKKLIRRLNILYFDGKLSLVKAKIKKILKGLFMSEKI